MELQRQDSGGNAILAYQADRLTIGHRHYRDSVLVRAQEIISPWAPLRAKHLSLASFDGLDLYDLELVIIGDLHLNFAYYQDLQISLSQKKIGCELMNLGAACRTFNILLAEERQVLGLFRLEI